MGARRVSGRMPETTGWKVLADCHLANGGPSGVEAEPRRYNVNRCHLVRVNVFCLGLGELGRPFRAGNCIGASFPGRCPGLWLERAFGAATSSRHSLDATTAGDDGRTPGFGRDARNNRLEGPGGRPPCGPPPCGPPPCGPPPCGPPPCGPPPRAKRAQWTGGGGMSANEAKTSKWPMGKSR
jgi:hypothetical protein